MQQRKLFLVLNRQSPTISVKCMNYLKSNNRKLLSGTAIIRMMANFLISTPFNSKTQVTNNLVVFFVCRFDTRHWNWSRTRESKVVLQILIFIGDQRLSGRTKKFEKSEIGINPNFNIFAFVVFDRPGFSKSSSFSRRLKWLGFPILFLFCRSDNYCPRICRLTCKLVSYYFNFIIIFNRGKIYWTYKAAIKRRHS